MDTTFLSMGWRSLRRDLRAGELRLLIVAVMLAVASLTSVGFFADRLQGGLARDARQLLGGDVVVVSDNPTPQSFTQEAKNLGLTTSINVIFPTMARADDAEGGASKLVALKAVDAQYPLRGSMRVMTAAGVADTATRDVPAPGEAWVDPALPSAIGLKVGSTLQLGDKSFRISRLISIEPDRGTGFLSFSPRVMINSADLAATGLVQPASRLTYRFAVAGSDAAVKTFKTFADKSAASPEVRGLHVK
jgi:putative ABC transport system permease protein